jgi:hypothetical protein
LFQGQVHELSAAEYWFDRVTLYPICRGWGQTNRGLAFLFALGV